MTFNYTLAQAIKDAGDAKGISASIVTTILGHASKKQSHADAHMKGLDFWTKQREVSDGKGGTKKVGTTQKIDDHLKSTYKKRTKHSMFDSPESAVEAATAALNCKLGVQALTALLGEKGVDLYSRTAAQTMGATKQFNRSNPTKKAVDPATMTAVVPEYVVVCLRKVNTDLMIASAYPVASDGLTKLEQAGKDWYQKQGDATVIKSLPKVTPVIVNW